MNLRFKRQSSANVGENRRMFGLATRRLLVLLVVSAVAAAAWLTLGTCGPVDDRSSYRHHVH